MKRALLSLCLAACQAAPVVSLAPTAPGAQPLGAHLVAEAAASPVSARSAATSSPSTSGVAGVAAADPALLAESSGAGWRLAVQPYFWAAGLSGDVGLDQFPPAAVDLSFGEILQDLDFALMLSLEAAPEDARWGLLFDALYLNLQPENSGIDAEVEQLMLELDLALALAPELAGLEQVELLAGLRYWDMSVGLDSQTGPLKTDGHREWVDPILGARSTHDLSERWSLRFRGDLGGFGVGSDLTYQLLLAARYAWSPAGSVGFGYRHLDIDYDHDGFRYDAATRGPIAGVSFSF